MEAFNVNLCAISEQEGVGGGKELCVCVCMCVCVGGGISERKESKQSKGTAREMKQNRKVRRWREEQCRMERMH